MHNASAPSVYTQVMKRMDDSKSISAHSKNTRGQFSMHNSFRVGWGAGRMFAMPARVDRDMKTSVAIRSVHSKEQNGTDRFLPQLLCTHTQRGILIARNALSIPAEPAEHQQRMQTMHDYADIAGGTIPTQAHENKGRETNFYSLVVHLQRWSYSARIWIDL